jgi:hypothetical protein
MDSLQNCTAPVEPLAVLSRFRLDFHACLTARGDQPFELADVVPCADGPVRTLAALSLAPEHRRGHGALYDAVNHGEISIGRLRRSLAGLPLPRAAEGQLVLAANVSNWLRPGAAASPPATPRWDLACGTWPTGSPRSAAGSRCGPLPARAPPSPGASWSPFPAAVSSARQSPIASAAARPSGRWRRAARRG